MLITSFAAPMFATNCWILATGAGNECVIVDPGMPNVSDSVAMLVDQHRLKPVAILVTHGHLDHTFSVRPVAQGYEIPAYIHSEDRVLLAHPEKAHGVDFMSTLKGETFSEPTEVRELKNGSEIEIVGLKIRAIHSPGHTRGSVMFEINNEVLVSGDVLFRGSIGRTDLPTGSSIDMEDTLIRRVLPLRDDLRVLPGHGPDTTIAHERKTNPYLAPLIKRVGSR
ncbi:unannotated protein [freshwater metagenome]|uniref:Unannotated protein n=1 Tax=freshwater metagenome TaxID=449393 RepID=A0A6J7XPK7_9ZZZZ|nr:MBL fold metallo-hydrolase [Actinomycetota bacterium]